jgi:penicillin-binding protein 1A
MVPNLVTGVWVGCETVQPGSRALLTVRGSCIAGLGYFMKLCYADPQLKVSKEEFERPENLSIKSGCYSAPKQKILLFQIQMNSNLRRLSYLDIRYSCHGRNQP